MNEIKLILHKIGIIPVVKMDSAENAVPLANALKEGGLAAAEITFRSDAAEESIKEISNNVPDFYICAGTVLSIENAERAVRAGAKAIISPGTDLDVVRWCQKNKIPVIPGISTPTELQECMAQGLDLVKLFPAEVVGGVKMLKALAGPFSNIKFMPTGGIKPNNVSEYLSQKNVAACGGTWIVPENLLSEKRFYEIKSLALEAAKLRDKIYEN